MLQLLNLTKVYHLLQRRIVAVKNVSVGIPAGEVGQTKKGIAVALLLLLLQELRNCKF